MMRFLFLLILFSLFVESLSGQRSFKNLDELEPSAKYSNIHVQPIGGDSLSSAFVIWVKSHVALHYHAAHSENIMVISGHGLMRIGDESQPIVPGDHLFIPANTPHAVTVKSKEPLKVLSVQSPHFDGSDRVMLE